MKYAAALEYLYALRKTGIKLRLSHTEHLLSLLGNPEADFSSVHVAGTNGKGSVCAMIYSTLVEAGLSTGLYTSPHLSEFTERIKVDGKEIPKKSLTRLLEDIMPMVDVMGADESLGKPSFFEVVTALAFKHLSDEEVDYAVVETGLGGRLDATNVLKPVVSVITNVQLDHTEVLGNSLEDIAREKAGIIKKETPAVTAESDARALEVLETACLKNHSPLYVVGEDVNYRIISCGENGIVFDVEGLRKHKGLKTNLLGRHQALNAATAVAALDIINAGHDKITEENIRNGLKSVDWPARFEQLNTKPKIILDCAHNPAGAETLAKTLEDLYPKNKVILVFGASNYKDVPGILAKLTPKAKAVLAVRSRHPQAESPEKLCDMVKSYGIQCTDAHSMEESIGEAKKLAGKEGVIVFAGSIFAVGDARKKLCGRKTR